MKRDLKRLLLFIFSATASGLCFAGGWGIPVTITGYYVSESGGAFFTTSDNENPDACSSSQYLVLDPSQPNFKELYATLMAAQAASSTISVYYNGCSGEYPIATSIAVPKAW